MVQPLHRGIRCCVEGSETTFELVYRAAVDDVRHGLGGSTDAQWVVGITPLMETGCTLASAWAETVRNAQQNSVKLIGESELCDKTKLSFFATVVRVKLIPKS